MRHVTREDRSDRESCANCAKKLILWSLSCSLFLSAVKLGGGILSGSSGLVADGLQSITCMIGSLAIMGSMILSQKEPDESFPYGYTKIEFVVALVVFSGLFALGFLISLMNFLAIVKRQWGTPEAWSLPIAVTSLLLNRMMYMYCHCAGTKIRSVGMISNACQHKADMYSSLAVAVGILLAQFGAAFAIADSLAALLVGILILVDAYRHWTTNVRVLLDAVPEPAFRRKIGEIVLAACPGEQLGYVQVKRIGHGFWLGIGLDFPDCETIHAMEVRKSRIRSLTQYRLPWVEKIDFFLEAPP